MMDCPQPPLPRAAYASTTFGQEVCRNLRRMMLRLSICLGLMRQRLALKVTPVPVVRPDSGASFCGRCSPCNSKDPWAHRFSPLHLFFFSQLLLALVSPQPSTSWPSTWWPWRSPPPTSWAALTSSSSVLGTGEGYCTSGGKMRARRIHLASTPSSWPPPATPCSEWELPTSWRGQSSPRAHS